MIRTVTVREHERVDLSGVSPDARRRVQIREQLLAATADLPQAVFERDRSGQIWARDLVGMVEAANVIVQILPKVRSGSSVGDDAAFLLRLLAAARLIPHRMLAEGHIAAAEIPLLEVIVRAAAEQLQAVLGEYGPPRRYQEVEEESHTVLGIVDMTRAMRQLPNERHRIPIRHAPLQADNALARLLRALALHLEAMSSSRRSRGLLADGAAQLAAAGTVPLDEELAAAAEPSHAEEQWRDLYNLAAGLAHGVRPDPTRPGTSPSRVLLFSLDDIFERILRRAIPVVLAGCPMDLARRSPNLHYLQDVRTGEKRLRLRPDLLIVEAAGADTRPVVVADAKWKLIASGKQRLKLERNDVYQISAYMNRYRLPMGLLLFPREHQPGRTRADSGTRSFKLADSSSELRVITVDVAGLLSSDTSTQTESLDELRTELLSAAADARRLESPGSAA